MATLHEARSAGELDAVRGLFAEYERHVDAPCCFAGFEAELAGLPGPYFALILAEEDGAPAGCVAVRSLENGAAEMKRLYVRPAYRARGLGRSLARAAIGAARRAGHSRMLLDSLPSMREARALYRTLGFTQVPPYLADPTPGAACFELRI